MIRNMPAMLIRAYRRIPVPVRDLWDFGVSSSHLALADVMASATPWRTLWLWAWPDWRALRTQGPDQLWFTRKSQAGIDSPFWVLNGRRGNQ